MRSILTRGAALVLIATGLTGCGETRAGPEAEIRAWIDEMQAAAEDERRRDIVARIAEGYTDGRGNSREDVDNTLRGWFFRTDGITLLVDVEDIEIIADTAARVRLMVGMAGTGVGAFGISADAYRFELELGYTGDDWELLSARWGELGQPLN
jgi:hypothetical protein